MYYVTMPIVLCNISALMYWRSARSAMRAHKEVSHAKTKMAGVPTSTSPLPDALQELEHPLHILVTSASERRSSKIFTSHVWSGKLPKGFILDTARGFYVCSPELCFIQMAQVLSLPKLIELGYELCGTYQVTGNTLRERQPLTTVSRLKQCVAKGSFFRGAKKAARALRFVADNAASPREALVTMLLCLPYSLGGYGIALPFLNYRIESKKESAPGHRAGYFVCDLFWRDLQLAIEYDSDLYHTGSRRIAHDATRRAALAAEGITVVSVTRQQVNSYGDMKNVAHLIARANGKKLQYKEPRFTQRCRALRGTLLGHLSSGQVL